MGNMGFNPDDHVRYHEKRKRTMSIDKYRTDAKVVRSYKTGRTIVPPEDTTVGSAPSRVSLQNLVFILNNCDKRMTTMHTLTFQSDVSNLMRVEEHKQIVKSGLQKLRNEGATAYVWVKEFTEPKQSNGFRSTPHWHIFSDAPVETPSDKNPSGDWLDWLEKPVDLSRGMLDYQKGSVDYRRSVKWSRWLSLASRRKTDDMPQLQRHYETMKVGDGEHFIGSVRVERLRCDAAGRYAGKEGAKRFQKKAPEKWSRSGLWWKASINLKATPLQRIQVLETSLKAAEVVTGDGKKLSVPFKNQFGRGLVNEGIGHGTSRGEDGDVRFRGFNVAEKKQQD